LVQYYRFAKAEIWAQERDREKAELARKRHDFRQLRQERDKIERASRLHKKKSALHSAEAAADGPASEKSEKKAAILAALERARAKREGKDDSGAVGE
jgi:electron transport complex protein RnfC